MTGFFRFILFLLIFILVLRFIRFISRYWSTTKKTFKDIYQQKQNNSQRFKDVEEADFKEIPPDKKDDN